MKYIMFECNGSYLPVLFPDFMDHSMMSRCIQSEQPGYKPISAGRCNVGITRDCEVIASLHGESLTLKLNASKDDAPFITNMLNS